MRILVFVLFFNLFSGCIVYSYISSVDESGKKVMFRSYFKKNKSYLLCDVRKSGDMDCVSAKEEREVKIKGKKGV